jgi:zinc transport system substrate-binding protein
MKIATIIALLIITISMDAQPRFVTTIHPFKAIIQEIVGESGVVDEILPPGASPHTYELRPSELNKIEKATAFFYGAENLDGWAAKIKTAHRIELMKMLTEQNRLTLQNFVGNKKVIGTDPHFWTDPLTVKAMLPALVDTLCKLNPEQCTLYRKNSFQFSTQLDNLTQLIQESFSNVPVKEVLLAHPFFQYYFNRFGFKLIGTIETIPGSEPTPRDLKEIIDQARQRHLKIILVNPQISDRPAQLIAEATGAKIVELDPIGGVAGRETYDELLLYNTTILLQALQ